MVNQLHPKLDKNIKKYGCYFMSLAFFSGRDWRAEELNKIWETCIKKGYITGDLNKDGDMDDANEAIIVNPDGVCKELGLNYKYIGKHSEAHDPVPDNYIAIGRFYNKRTKFTHFVVINKYKSVIFDPIPNSITVREGVLNGMRLFKPV